VNGRIEPKDGWVERQANVRFPCRKPERRRGSWTSAWSVVSGVSEKKYAQVSVRNAEPTTFGSRVGGFVTPARGAQAAGGARSGQRLVLGPRTLVLVTLTRSSWAEFECVRPADGSCCRYDRSGLEPRCRSSSPNTLFRTLADFAPTTERDGHAHAAAYGRRIS
jgi:hypothetical protein